MRYGIPAPSTICFRQPLMLRKLSKRRSSNDVTTRKLADGDGWHHDTMAYLGAINTLLALLAIIRLYTIVTPSKAFSTGSVQGNRPLDVGAGGLGLANFSQAFMNFSTAFRSD